jgi:hypothetical protein
MVQDALQFPKTGQPSARIYRDDNQIHGRWITKYLDPAHPRTVIAVGRAGYVFRAELLEAANWAAAWETDQERCSSE